MLATLFSDPAAARQLLEEADIPAADLPWSASSPRVFWLVVSELLSAGISIGGPERLQSALRLRFPGNPVFADGPPDGVGLRESDEQEPAVWNVPPRFRWFVGREVLLTDLQQRLSRQGAVCMVRGLGGVGKTALAIEYAHQHATEFDVVWWMPAEDRELVDGHVAALGRELGLPDGADWSEVAVVLRRKRLRWLLIIDNVEDGSLLWWLRPSDPRGRMLVTSRQRGLWSAGVELEVAEFSAREAPAVLIARVPGIDPAVAGRIAELLGCLPLALEQAVGYLTRTGIPPADYAVLLEARLADMLGHGQVADRPGVTVANLWALSTDRLRLEHPAAAALLELCACCGADPIPLGLINRRPEALPDGPLRPVVDDPLAWEDTVGTLVGYGLARRDGPVLVVHRLTSAAVRAGMDPVQRSAYAASMIRLLAAVLPGHIRDPAEWPWWRELLPHLRFVLDEDRDDTGWDDPTATALGRLAVRTGQYLDHHGRADLATPYLQRGLAVAQARAGREHPDTLMAMNNLAGVYRTTGRRHEAVDLLEQALADAERTLGPDDPITLTSRHNLAYAYRSADLRHEAIGLFQQVVTDRERVLGPDHPSTLASRNELARAYESTGQTNAARELFEEVLANRARILGDDHPDTLGSLDSLAGAYGKAGRTSEAVTLFERVHIDRMRLLGPEHPATLNSANNLAVGYRAAGRLGDAIDLLEQALADAARVLGSDHLITLSVRATLDTWQREADHAGPAGPSRPTTAPADSDRRDRPGRAGSGWLVDFDDPYD